MKQFIPILLLSALSCSTESTPIATESEPKFRLVYSVAKKVHVVSIPGGIAKILNEDSNEESSPSWSHSGDRIAYAAQGSSPRGVCNTWKLYTAKHDGSDRLLVSLESCSAVEDFDWSSDGKIAYGTWDSLGMAIYIVSPGADIPHRVTPPYLQAFFPRWAGTTHVVFYNLDSNYTRQIWVINADGSNPRRLTDEPHNTLLQFAVSADGLLIAYFAGSFQSNALFVLGVDGSPKRAIVSSLWNPGFPSWSANGQDILFTSRDTVGFHQIVVVNVDAPSLRYLTIDRANYSYPSWSPDGLNICYLRETSFAASTYSIWTMAIDTTRRDSISALADQYSAPLWSPIALP